MSELEQQETAPVVNNSIPTQKPKKSIGKKIAIAIGVIVVLIVGLLLVVDTATSAPLKVADEFVAKIQADESSYAYDLMSTDAKAVTSSQDFVSIVDRINPILTGKPSVQSKEINAETGSDDKAVIVYEINGSDNNTYILTVTLIKTNDQWKILGFESAKK